MLKKVWAYLVIITGAVAGGTLATFVPDGHESQANSPPALITPALFAATPVVANKPVVDGELTGDWKQWGGSSDRNNVAVGVNIPTAWEVGDIDEETGAWDAASAENIKWVAQCGSQTYGNVVIADGRAFIGTNNRAGYLARYPGDIDLGCLLCFSTKDGSFLWQHSSEKLDTGRVHDWPLQGVCCASYVEGNRLWFVTSRGEVVCLDTEGYHDGEDDGPAKAGMGRLFLESPLLQAGLDENNLLPALAALLETNGVSLDGQTRLKVEEEGTRWLLQIRGEDGTAFYRITREDPQLHVVKIADEQETNGQPVVSAHTRLTEGLDQGQVSPALAALLAKRGFDLKQVKVTKDGNAWKLAGTVDGKPRTGLVRMQGPNLTAFKQITAEDKGEADQIWVYDMMKEQAVSQHNMCSCSVTAMGDLLFVNTSNGV
ncbi:MAG: hypothetical protein KDA99_05040, partial [Planctomycetales bacterium]|nr:hypothetical protein [Planctomycetales bacterium]